MTNKKIQIDRRSFLKLTGATAAVAGSSGLGFFGYQAGKDPDSYTGNEGFQGKQYFNRKKYRVDKPTYEKVGTSERVDARTEVIFQRMGKLMRGWDEEKGLDGLNPLLQDYYRKHPKDLDEDLRLRKEIFPLRRIDSDKYSKDYLLAEAWSDAMGEVWPDGIHEAPAESDFPKPRRDGSIPPRLKMKSSDKTSKLIKQMTYQFGSALTGITKLNHDWVYKHPMRGRGIDQDTPFDVPQHWKYAIVVGTPMSWDAMYANPTYGTSHDAYAKSRIVAYRLAAFIRSLGYAARPHTPGTEYDLMVVPIAIDAGLGEQGRHSVLITPEFGSNFRPAIVTTDLPMECDKPIDIGVQKFCETCKICAEKCPSGSISKKGKVEIRGYKRYELNISTCYNFWYSNLGNIGCRICVASCPFTRKSNWLHKTAANVTAGDPTGLSHKLLTKLQKSFYPSPEPEEYYIPSMGGKNASYRPAPWWLKTEDFIEL